MARYSEEQRNLAYRIYVTDSLKMINDNMASYFGGTTIIERYIESIEPQMQIQVEHTAQSIVESIAKKAGLEVIHSESV